MPNIKSITHGSKVMVKVKVESQTDMPKTRCPKISFGGQEHLYMHLVQAVT